MTSIKYSLAVNNEQRFHVNGFFTEMRTTDSLIPTVEDGEGFPLLVNVALDGPKIVGVAYIAPLVDEVLHLRHSGRQAEAEELFGYARALNQLTVRPEYRKLGIGRNLLTRARSNLSSETSAAVLIARIEPNNISALAFYDTFGMTVLPLGQSIGLTLPSGKEFDLSPSPNYRQGALPIP